MAALISSLDTPLPALLYWDASFLVHATYPAARYHQDCYRFLDRLNNAEDTVSYVSTLTLDETIFALIQLKVVEQYPERRFWDTYRADPKVIQVHLGEIRMLIDRLATDPHVQLVSPEPDCMSAALDHMASYPLLPRDALHLTIMARHGIDSIATTDSDFLAVDGLHLYTCNPRILAKATPT